jgi:hypothetical protein
VTEQTDTWLAAKLPGVQVNAEIAGTETVLAAVTNCDIALPDGVTPIGFETTIDAALAVGVSVTLTFAITPAATVLAFAPLRMQVNMPDPEPQERVFPADVPAAPTVALIAEI